MQGLVESIDAGLKLSVVGNDEQGFVRVDPTCCDEFLKKIGDSVRRLKGECVLVKDEWNRGVGE